MPGIKAVGTNTAARMMAMAITGPETSSMALRVASLGESPCSMWCSTASTTTMASSTTSPMARTSPKRDKVLMEKPKSGNRAKVPMRETGTARRGMRVARQPCRNRNTTRMTRKSASKRVWTISLMPSVTARVVSRATTTSRSGGKLALSCSMSFLVPSAASMALEPGS